MSNSDPTLHLAADFPAATDDQWLKLVDKVLAGADFDKKLVSHTYDGIAIKPLYTRADWPPTGNEGDASGFPGGAPFTRGGGPLGTALSGWDIRQAHGGADETAVNKAILEDLERGVTSILLRADHLTTPRAMDQALAGVMLDLAPMSLESTGATLPAAILLMGVVAARGQAAAFAGNFGLDDLGSGWSETSVLAATAVKVAQDFPMARAFNVRGTVYHAAGAADAQELGCAIATALTYLRAMTAAGLDIDAACGQIAFTLAADADFFLSIAKFRALRKLWARVTEVCGANLEHRSAPVAACTATRMMTRRDPWVNVLRTTVACFAAGVGGADAVTVLPFDTASAGNGSDLARRVARNTQIVLQEEASLAKVADPAGGAWMFERLTDELADKAWAFFQEIERAGGMAAALNSGFVAEKIKAVQTERAKNIARRKDVITGVSEFPNIAEPDPAGVSIDAPFASGLMPIRLASGFERLRDASDAVKKKAGERPRIFLANLGAIADFTARAGYARNFFEAGGIKAVPGAGGVNPADMARDFTQSGATFAVICGTDAVYAESAAPVAKALKGAGAAIVYLAGRPGEQESAWRAAGIDEFIYMGCDVLATLERAHAKVVP
ncbi:MAG: methylmalonyl-CoA mutase family protein [Rhodospirillaceae bacterium]